MFAVVLMPCLQDLSRIGLISLVPMVMVSGCSVLSRRVRHDAELPYGIDERVQRARLIDARNKVMGGADWRLRTHGLFAGH
jgi:hypothetical protein